MNDSYFDVTMERDSQMSMDIDFEEPMYEDVPELDVDFNFEVTLEDIERYKDNVGHELSEYEPDSSYTSVRTQSEPSEEEDDEMIEFEVTNMERPSLHVGLCFNDVNICRDAVIHYALRGGSDIKYLKSDKTRLTVKCAIDECPWRLHASKLDDDRTFMIKKLNDEHICQFVDASASHMASSRWLSNKILQRLKDEPGVKTRTLINDIRREYHIDVPYMRMWRAKEKAWDAIRGRYEDSYNLLPSFKASILACNPGSIVKLQTERDGSFLRVFMAYKACISGFLIVCRPFIGLDGTFLKGKFKGVLLSAIALDANNGIFPLAIAVVQAENVASWTWFLQCLRPIVGDTSLVFMSDRQKGLIEAVGKEFSSCMHRYCMRHVYANFVTIHKGAELRDLFWDAARSYTQIKFDKCLEDIQKKSQAAYDWIVSIPASHWARAYFPEWIPCNQIENNFVESFNNFILDSRDIPITAMLDKIRQKWMVMMQRRREESSRWDGIVCPKVRAKINEIGKRSRSCELYFSGDDEYEVVCPSDVGLDERHAVKVSTRTCSCRQWQLSGIPCVHAYRAIAHRRENVELYCHHSLYIEAYKSTYQEILHPIPDQSMWEGPNQGMIRPPYDRRPPGRPKKNRKKDPNENICSSKRQKSKVPIKCSRCKKKGHNRRSCKEPINERMTHSQDRVNDSQGVDIQSSECQRVNKRSQKLLATRNI